MNSVASLRHHDKNVVALLDQQAGQLGRFVGGDRAGHAEDDGSFCRREAHNFPRSCFACLRAANSGHEVVSYLDQTPAQISLRAHDVPKFLQVLLHRLADDGVAIIAPELHFARGVREPRVDLFRRFGAAFGQATAQFLEVRRHDENIGQRLPDKFVVAIADRGRALGVDVDQHIDALLQIGAAAAPARCRNNARAPWRARGIRPPPRARRKFGLGKKMIIFAVDLAGARRARGAGNRVNEIRRLAERVAEGRLAGAGRRGDDEQEFRNG